MKIIENKQFDEERALYHLCDAKVVHCTFAGEKDGESVLKEARQIHVDNCSFSLRYPMWHVDTFHLIHSSMDEFSRAPIWYAKYGVIENSQLHCIKAVRECQDIAIKGSDIDSAEFGWKSENIALEDTKINAEYLFLDSKHVSLKNVDMKGKYSFQYMKDLVIEDSYLDTKDAFWHSKNVTVRNSTVKGEYLGWFSDGLTLIDCHIIGTQPLCYCKNLKLSNCTMEACDLSFEYSDVEAEIQGSIDSVKNPRSGKIICDDVKEIIMEDAVMECQGEVILRQND